MAKYPQEHVTKKIEYHIRNILERLSENSSGNAEITVIGDNIYIDSMGIVDLVTALELEFNLTFSSHEFVIDMARSVDRLVSIVVRKMS